MVGRSWKFLLWKKEINFFKMYSCKTLKTCMNGFCAQKIVISSCPIPPLLYTTPKFLLLLVCFLFFSLEGIAVFWQMKWVWVKQYKQFLFWTTCFMNINCMGLSCWLCHFLLWHLGKERFKLGLLRWML